MRLIKLTTCGLAILFVLLLAVPMKAQTKEDITTAKIVEMTKAGLSSETIINSIISSGATFELTADDVLSLKEQGVDEDVINFMLRTRPLSTGSETEGMASEAGAPGEPGDPTMDDQYYSDSSYIEDDPYVYTDGYNFENERSTTLIYHYYGPWFRAYPYYYGFYYYPASYYYWCYWPDDYYYYFYYPRFTTWRYYYYYPRYQWSNYHYRYVGGRYIHAKGGRYVDRGTSSGYSRYAVPRYRDGRDVNRDSSIRSSQVRTKSGYYGGSTRGTITRDVTRSYRDRQSVPRRDVTPRRDSTYRSRSPISKRSSEYQGRTSRSRSSVPSRDRSYSSSPSSRSKSSTVRSSRSSRSSASSPSRSSSRSSSSKSSSSRSAKRK